MIAPLPHRYPALRVDRVLHQSPERAVALKLVSCGEMGLGEAWLLELLAQTSAFLSQGPLDEQIRVAAFQAVEFLAFASPGDRLEAEVLPEDAFGTLSRVRGEVRCGERTLCRARIVLTRGTP